jgi:cation-transporting ATPase 13A3/4/5
MQYYAQNGYRVIACGVRTFNLTTQEIMLKEREDVEQQLDFLGFIILENKLKPVTTENIKHLQSANIRTIMITGDNILTAISVAKSCCIIQPNQRVYYGEMK